MGTSLDNKMENYMIRSPLSDTLCQELRSEGNIWAMEDCTTSEAFTAAFCQESRSTGEAGAMAELALISETVGDAFYQKLIGTDRKLCYDVRWKPTEQDYRECCGVWVPREGDVCYENRLIITPEHLVDDCENIEHFHSRMKDWTKIEPIPEQCIPKPEVERERYPWADTVDRWLV